MVSARVLSRPFGDSGLRVPALGLGAGHLDAGRLIERDAFALLDTALDLGITFVDTARGYGDSEERIGRWLPRHRDEIVLSTKVGYDVPGAADWSREAVVLGVEQALRRLRTDTIEVVFLHSCSLEVLQRGEAIAGLLACRDDGKVRVAGYSGENEALAWAMGAGVFGAVQTSVNLADQRSLREVLPLAARAGLGVVAKRPLANVAWRHRSRPVGVYGETYWSRLREMAIGPEADDWYGTALRFAVFGQGVSTAIVGTSRPVHLAAAAEAVARGPLPESERRRWQDAFAAHAGEWPGEV